MLILASFVNLWRGTLGREDIILFTVTTSFPLHANPLPAAGFVALAREDQLPETEIDLQRRRRTDRGPQRPSKLREWMPDDPLGRKTKPDLHPSSAGR
jgi:hypothetical protein